MSNIVLWYSAVVNGIFQLLFLHCSFASDYLEWIIVVHALTSFMNHGFSFHWWKVADRTAATLMVSVYSWIAPLQILKVCCAASVSCYLFSKLLHHYRYIRIANLFHICCHFGISIYTYIYIKWKQSQGLYICC